MQEGGAHGLRKALLQLVHLKLEISSNLQSSTECHYRPDFHNTDPHPEVRKTALNNLRTTGFEPLPQTGHLSGHNAPLPTELVVLVLGH